MGRWVVSIALLALLAQASCGTAPTVTPAPMSTFTPAVTSTPEPANTPTSTPTQAPTSTPTITPTPRLPVSLGTARPGPAGQLSAETADQIIELARWGRGVIVDLAYSSDGKAIALASTGGVILVAADTLEEVSIFDSPSRCNDVALSADGSLIAAGLEDGTVAVWSAESGELVKTLSGPAEAINAVAFSPDGRLLAGGSEDNSVSIWQVADGTLQATFKSHTQAITALAFSPDGQSIFSGSEDTSVHQLQVTDGKRLRVFGGYTDAGISLSADGAILAAAGGSVYTSSGAARRGKVSLWTVADGKQLRTLDVPGVTGVALSPDGQFVAAAEEDHTAKVWDVASGESVATYADLKSEDEDAPAGSFFVGFSPSGGAFAMGGLDTVALWDASSHKLLLRARTHSGPVYAIAASPDGALLASVGYVDVQLRSLLNGDNIPLGTEITGSYAVEFSPDGSYLAVGGKDGKATLWPLDDPAHLQVFEDATHRAVTALGFSPDGRTFAFSAKPRAFSLSETPLGKIRLHNLADGALATTLVGSNRWYVSELAYSPAGDLVEAVSPGDRIVVIRLSDGLPQYIFNNGLGAAFSADGSLLAGATTNKAVLIWDMSNGKEILKIPNLPEYVWTVDFSPDGSLLAGGDEKGTVYIWKAADGSVLRSWQAHTSYVNDLMFLPDGSTLITASGDGTIKFWGLKP